MVETRPGSASGSPARVRRRHPGRGAVSWQPPQWCQGSWTAGQYPWAREAVCWRHADGVVGNCHTAMGNRVLAWRYLISIPAASSCRAVAGWSRSWSKGPPHAGCGRWRCWQPWQRRCRRTRLGGSAAARCASRWRATRIALLRPPSAGRASIRPLPQRIPMWRWPPTPVRWWAATCCGAPREHPSTCSSTAMRARPPTRSTSVPSYPAASASSPRPEWCWRRATDPAPRSTPGRRSRRPGAHLPMRSWAAAWCPTSSMASTAMGRASITCPATTAASRWPRPASTSSPRSQMTAHSSSSTRSRYAPGPAPMASMAASAASTRGR